MSMAETTEIEDSETVSLHQRILSDIREKILSGAWAPGHRIPFEHELTAEYKCSRMTVNKALSQLAKAGLIERRRRSGSFVRQPQSQAAVLERNVSPEVAARFKRAKLANVTAAAGLLRGVLPELERDGAIKLAGLA